MLLSTHKLMCFVLKIACMGKLFLEFNFLEKLAAFSCELGLGYQLKSFVSLVQLIFVMLLVVVDPLAILLFHRGLKSCGECFHRYLSLRIIKIRDLLKIKLILCF